MEEYAEVDDEAVASVPRPSGVKPGTSLRAFIHDLALPDSCLTLAAEAGIDNPADFKMFSESELVSEHGFKVGHARKILMKLG